MGTRSLETLTEAIDALAECDVDDLSDAELNDHVIELARQHSRLEAVHCRMIHRWDARQVWADNGSKAPGARLARETGMRHSRAKALVRRARHLPAMPATSRAYAAGELSGDHVDLLAACNQPDTAAAFADAETILVEACHTRWFDNAVRTLAYWKQRVDADGAAESAARMREGRHASIGTGWRGEVVLDAVFDPVDGEVVMTALERIIDELQRADLRDGTERTAQQRRADAIVELARRAMTAPADGLRPRPLVTVVIGLEPFTHACHTGHGTVIAPDTIIPLLSDADVERIVFDPPNRTAQASHRRRFVGSVRRIIQVRDGHCQHPSGCDVPAQQCDIDHVVPWSQGGPTSVDNGQLLCATHNRITKNHGPRPPLRRHERTGDPLPFRSTLVDDLDTNHDGRPATPTPRPPPAQAV